MNIRNTKFLKTFRQQLRKNATPAERKMWQYLRNRRLGGRKFKRQYSVGPYILDFFCNEESPAIELDGSVHDDPMRRDYDDKRTAYLHEQGIRVVRFENREVFEHPDIVVDAIGWHFFDEDRS